LKKRGDDDNMLIVPTVYKFNGKTKEFEKLLRDPNMIKAYGALLKDLKCKPWEVGERLRSEVWKNKSPREILAELEKD
jgi:hypothetical protein